MTQHHRGTERPVQDGADAPRRLLPSLTAGNDVLPHHEPRDKQGASKPGTVSPDPSTTSSGVRVSLTHPAPKRNGDRGAGQRPVGGCGTTFAGPSKTDPGTWCVQWVPDRTMGCEHCGPWVREQKARAYLAQIGNIPLFKRVVAADGWDTTAKRLRRADADYLQVPASAGLRVVLADKGPGLPVANNEEEILGLLAAYPAGCGINISASKAWQPAKAQVKPTAGDDREVYDFRFLVQAGLEHAREVAHELGLFMGEVRGSGGAAFLLRKPADPVTWGRFRRWASVESVEKLAELREDARARKKAAQALRRAAA